MELNELIAILRKKFSNPKLSEDSDMSGIHESDRRIIYALEHYDKELQSLRYDNARMKDYIVKQVLYKEN